MTSQRSEARTRPAPAVKRRAPGGGRVCHPTGVSMPTQLRWRMGRSDLLPEQAIVEHDYLLPETQPITAGMKTYARCDGLDRFDMHDALECGFVLEGSVIRYWGSTQQRRLCGPGAVWFCPSYEPNGYRLVDTPCRLAVFEIRPQWVAGLNFPQAPNLDWLRLFSAPWKERPLRVRDVGALRELGARLERALQNRDGLRPLRVHLILVEFLMLAMGPLPARSGRPMRNRDLQDRLRPAIDLALRSRQRVDNREGARACGLSTDQFMRAFRKVMGVSFIRFGLRHRLQGAANDLATGMRPFKAIAPEWGFTDESHMSHVFVKHLSCTPTQYRARALRDASRRSVRVPGVRT